MEKSKNNLLLAQCKAYHTLEETLKLCEIFINKQAEAKPDIYISAPYTYIDPISQKFSPNGIHVGAENMLCSDDGTFTSSISGKMVKESGAKFVLIGTAQERQFIKDKKHSLTNKVQSALQNGIVPFVCIGESEHDFHDGHSKEVLTGQLNEVIAELTAEQKHKLHIVYDVAWINKSPWTAASKEIPKACNTFYDVVSAAFDPAVLKTLTLLAPVPAYSTDLPKIIAAIPQHFNGYSFGFIDSSAEFVTPMTNKI